MDSPLILAIAVLVILLIAIILFKARTVVGLKLPYTTRLSLFNRSEAAFFLELKKQLPEGFNVFPKVRMIDFLEIDSRATRSPIWLHKIWAKHVDFLICDRNFKPILAIEVNGGSHNSPQKIQRDVFVKNVYAAAGLPLEAVNVGSQFNDVINSIVTKILSKESPPVPSGRSMNSLIAIVSGFASGVFLRSLSFPLHEQLSTTCRYSDKSLIPWWLE
ncbi:DUF2726 domain-containing protein [Patescibacteria group bacterium]|nr:DUF2726 domain-containing protein [Patescibacteria group bacterium]